MKRPRRHRFSALPEGTFQIQDSGAEPFVIDPAGAATPTEDEIDAPADTDTMLPVPAEGDITLESEYSAATWPVSAEEEITGESEYSAATWPVSAEGDVALESEYSSTTWPVSAEGDIALGSEYSAAPFRPLQPSGHAGPRPSRKRRSLFRVAVVASLASLLVGGFVGYLLARSAQDSAGSGMRPAIPAIPEKVELLTPADQGALDAAYTARHARQFAQAEQLFTALGHQHPHWDAMDIEVGRTLLHQRNYLGARAALNPAADHGLVSAEASLYIGVAYNAEGSYTEAEASFARAAALDPSQPDCYFLWGECLRAQGKLMDAMSKFRSALLRNEDETGAGLYRVKLWLCAIEANQEKTDGTSAEIDAALAQPLPPMETLFAAAARDLKNGDVKAAAAHLRSARQRADPTVFLLIMSDPLFTDARLKPEMAELFGSISPPASH